MLGVGVVVVVVDVDVVVVVAVVVVVVTVVLEAAPCRSCFLASCLACCLLLALLRPALHTEDTEGREDREERNLELVLVGPPCSSSGSRHSTGTGARIFGIYVLCSYYVLVSYYLLMFFFNLYVSIPRREEELTRLHVTRHIARRAWPGLLQSSCSSVYGG